MKNLKTIVKALLISAFMTVVISTNGNMPIRHVEIETGTKTGGDLISVYSEYPSLDKSISGN